MIYTFGNSHAHLFTDTTPSTFGIGKLAANFTSFSLGPVIAYNFYNNHYIKILDLLKKINFNKEQDHIMIIVGEVDCRWHLPLQAHIQKRTYEDIVEECLERFFLTYLDLKNKGYKIIGWGGHPSTTSGHSDIPDSPIFGDCLERNKISLLWDRILYKKCKEENIPYISIIHDLIDKNGLTKMEYFDDYCHLNYKKTKKLIEEKFSKVII